MPTCSSRQRPVPPNAGAVGRLALTAALLVPLAACSGGSTDSAGSVPVDAPTPAREDRAACRSLLEELPDSVADQPARPVDPADGWAAAWGDPAIVLTCGGPPPEGFRRTSTCTTVNDVDWFIPEEQLESDVAVELTMTTVNRAQFVAVTLPAAYSPPATALADLSSAVSGSVEATGSCF